MFKKKRWDRVCHWADKVIEGDKDNLKARQRRAKADYETKQLAKCEEDVAFVLVRESASVSNASHEAARTPWPGCTA